MAKNKTISPGNLGAEIAAILSDYTREVQEAITADVVEVAKDTKNELKNTSPKLTGSYSKGWTTEKVVQTESRIVYRIKNKTDWQLTHLLEYGHAKPGGGMTRAIPHIDPADRKAREKLLRKIKESIQKS